MVWPNYARDVQLYRAKPQLSATSKSCDVHHSNQCHFGCYMQHICSEVS